MLDPESILDQAWGAGYRAGFYPDDYEPIPDTPGTSDWVEWVEGYFAGCAANKSYRKHFRTGRKLTPLEPTQDKVTGEWI